LFVISQLFQSEEKILLLSEKKRRTYDSERIVVRSLVVFGKMIAVDFESKFSVDDGSIMVTDKDDDFRNLSVSFSLEISSLIIGDFIFVWSSSDDRTDFSVSDKRFSTDFSFDLLSGISTDWSSI